MAPASTDSHRSSLAGPTSARDAVRAWITRLRGWNAMVAASAIIVVPSAAALGIGWVASLHTRTTQYTIPGGVTRVDLVVSSGQAVIVGSSSSTLEVRRTDSRAFGHTAIERRSLAGGVLHISSHCPRIIVGSCSASYELAVPESVAVQVRTNSGDVRITGFNGNASVVTRSGSVDVAAYCGFDLSATSVSGDLHVATACPPEHLSLRTVSGNAVALVPPGRYAVVARSGSGGELVNGVTPDPTAYFSIDVLSSSGNVAVEGGL